MTDPDEIVATWSRDWREALPTTDPARQAEILAEARRAIAELQRSAANSSGGPGHALHRKTIFASSDVSFEVASALPAGLQLGPLIPGSKWKAVLRLSSAFPLARPDAVPDQRGLAVRIQSGEARLDLLATTGEAHHARDHQAMIASLKAAAASVSGGPIRALGVLVRELGFRDGLRMARTVSRAAKAGISASALAFYSRAPFQLGDYAVRYRFAPITGTQDGVLGDGADALATDLTSRLEKGPIGWHFQLQGFIDRVRTPMDDHRIAWRSPWFPVASLTIHGSGTPIGSVAFRAHPSWPDPKGAVFAPLGELNLLRPAAYETSQQARAKA